MMSIERIETRCHRQNSAPTTTSYSSDASPPSTMSDSQSKTHHYEEPASLLRKSSISHFTGKYEKPVVNIGGSSGGHYSSKMRSSKSMSSLHAKPKTDAVKLSGNLLDENEIAQIELFFRAHKTFVYVSRCMANLYFTKTDLVNGGRTSSPRSHEWDLTRTGVPIIVFDKGETKSRDKRQLQICLAERGTGFTLWRDVIDNLTDYKALHPCFHTLYLSCDHRKMAGLSFDDSTAAELFHRNIEAITSDPLNIALSIPKKGNSKKEKVKLKSVIAYKKPKKCDISTPCQFEHITNIDLSDFGRFHSINTLVTSPVVNRQATLLRRSSVELAGPYQSPQPTPSPISSTASSLESSEHSSQFSL